MAVASAVLASAPPVGIDVRRHYREVRGHTEDLCRALSAEDQCVQSMPDASPAKWHKAHTTWFFEEFVLGEHAPGYVSPDPRFRYLFNSYYETVGDRHPRPQRGLLTRPTVAEVDAYRRYVDAAMLALLEASPDSVLEELVVLGLHHEQQHQELLATDMLHAFSCSPLCPAMQPGWEDAPAGGDSDRFVAFGGGMVGIGAGDGFAFDSETPAHRVFLPPYRLATGLVRNSDFLRFIEAGGYRTPTLWMADGWAEAQAQGWTHPLYWREVDGAWMQAGPGGLAPLVSEAPVRHVSWYEADAFARWAGHRLPTEHEWEAAAADPRLADMSDRVWQWTTSAYGPYPGYRPAEGAIGEYNGKFMINQMVLRGGSCATPQGHTRASYRNFFHPDKRWQFSGLRLAADA
jgi:ergothioneine biosynthesis protein EgtB